MSFISLLNYFYKDSYCLFLLQVYQTPDSGFYFVFGPNLYITEYCRNIKICNVFSLFLQFPLISKQDKKRFS